jgi:hypothetical protein
MDLEPRYVGLLGLLALVPWALYAFGGGNTGLVSALITAFNVCLITASLYMAFGPSGSEPTGHESVSSS